jgi:hypothetical protein
MTRRPRRRPTQAAALVAAAVTERAQAHEPGPGAERSRARSGWVMNRYTCFISAWGPQTCVHDSEVRWHAHVFLPSN